jgi:glutamate dehydrogenase
MTSSPTPQALQESVDGLLANIGSRSQPAQGKRELARAFFSRSDDGYLEGRGLDSQLRQWLDFADWADVRADGEVLVRIFNPSKKTNGYSLDRTILQSCMPDQPFIFDSLQLLLQTLGVAPLRCIHPIVSVQRTARGNTKSVNPRPVPGEPLESMMHFELPRIKNASQRKAIQQAVLARMERVRLVVSDHQSMRERAKWLAGHLGDETTKSTQDHFRRVTLAQKFLHWLIDDNFVFLGFAELEEGDKQVEARPDSRLGLSRNGDDGRTAFSMIGQEWLGGDEVIFLSKGESEAEIHRAGKTDHVAVRVVRDGQPYIALFTGLYTSTAINEEVSRIPILREKLEAILEERAVLPGSQLGRKLEEAFRAIPVEFLFTADLPPIERALQLVIRADEGQETGVHLLIDESRRAAFALVSLPRERYDEGLRQAVSAKLLEQMGANYMDDRVAFGNGGNVVLQFFLTAAEHFSHPSEEAVKAAVEEITGSWVEKVGGHLEEQGESGSQVERLVERYEFSADYIHRVTPEEAASDINYLEEVRTRQSFAVALAKGDEADITRIKLFQPRKVYLTDSTPVLNHFGLNVIDQTSTPVSADDATEFHIDSFRVLPKIEGTALLDHSERLVDALRATFADEARNDELNALVIGASLSWREVGILRALIAYARQLGATNPIPNVHRAWNQHPAAADLLIKLFHARFDPSLGAADDADRRAKTAGYETAFLDYLGGVDNAADDRILRRSLNYVLSILRTNYYSRASEPGHPLSFKVDCSAIAEMVSPRPYREIFVHHLAVEGVHLRGGPVARGGLRWSDRQADYRTEILGLMDTQMIKNVLIVPVGAKGGFILKGGFNSRQAAREAADRYYEVFIRGLLDLTDNVIEGEVIPPKNVLRYDDHDPYLVVAADKGTAHLSDTANNIAADYGFWLDDAFASGGSAGYDHKKYGITAKGAWVCVRRHFREMSLDPEKAPITVVGVGDMSGDVFGNGMLLSKTMRLQAAFNHMHIFLDPSPDAKTAWKERKRLFGLTRSTWEDYNESSISEGGGIHPRHSKSIALTPEVREMLGCEDKAMSGDALVHAILGMEADLLWNAGIGTYVKASYETDRDAGDSANDCVRVDAADLRFRVVGEGGNLGFTQAARVEFAGKGGRINSDAMDNSGGVDMSDHEVNLKILFTDLIRAGVVDRAERDDLLLKVAEEVSTAVQSNNHMHSLMASLDINRSVKNLDDFRVLLNDLESEGRLDRDRHVLPSDGEMLRRMQTGEGLSRPELTRLGPFVKMKVYEALIDDPRFSVVHADDWLISYFPKRLRRRFGEAIRNHQLRREIAATVLTNRLVDAMGVTHFSRLTRVAGRDIVEVAYASTLAARLMNSWSLKTLLRDQEDVRVSVEYVKLRHIEQSVALLAQWLLKRGIDVLDPTAVLARFEDGFAAYGKAIGKIMDRTERRLYQRNLRYMRNRNIKGDGVEGAAALEFLISAGEAVLLSEVRDGLSVVQSGMLLKKIAVESQLLRAAQLATPEDARDGWESRAIADIRAHISQLTLVIAKQALIDLGPLQSKKVGSRDIHPQVVAAWQAYRDANESVFEQADHLATRIESARARGLAPAMVIYGAIRELKSEG